MKSNLTISTLKALLALSMVTSFVACSSNAQSRKPAALGTQDTGGGNGLAAGKIYEAYIIDVTTLPAYKYVKPIFEKLDSEESRKEGKGFESILKVKTWYLAPVSLKPLSKDAIGFSISEGENVQYAVQTKDKVVIDKNRFDKMSIKEQARLITHEMVMTMYLVKYMTFQEIQEAACRSGLCSAEDESYASGNWKEYIDIVYKPLPYKALSVNDYEHIRSVTGWLFNNAAKTEVTREQIYRLLLAHNFDKRIFTLQAGDSGEKKELRVTNSQEFLLKVTRRAQALGTMPDRCVGLKTGIKFPCKVTMEKAEDHIYTIPFLMTTPGFKVSILSDKVNRTLYGNYGTTMTNEVASNSTYDFMIFADHLPEACLVGERVDQAVALLSTQENVMGASFDVNRAPWDYEAIIFQPKVITGEFEPADDSSLNITQGTPKVTSLENDTIVAYSDDVKLEQTRAFSTSFMNGVPGNAYCRPKASK